MNNNTGKKSSSKTYLMLGVIVVIALIMYFYFQGSEVPESDTLAVSQSETVGLKVVALLNQVRSINIDASLFSDPAFSTLRDNTVGIPAQNVGRSNPFAPIPGVNRNTPATSR